jgi:hypothetical protein
MNQEIKLLTYKYKSIEIDYKEMEIEVNTLKK